MGDERLRRSLVSRGLFGFFLQFALKLRGLLLIPVLVRALPPTEVGVLNLGNAFIGSITPLLMLGLNTGFSLRVVHLSGPALRPAILTVLLFSAAISTMGTLGIFGAVHYGFLESALSPLIPVLAPLILLAIGTTTREVAIVFPQIRQDLRFVGWNSVVVDFGGVVFAIVLVLLGFGAYGALLGPGIMSGIAAALAVAYVLRYAEGPLALDPSFLRGALRSALPVVPLSLALWTLQSSDYFVISHFQGTGALAIYGLANNLASPALLALAAMNLTYLPTCVEILGRGRQEFATFMDNSTRYVALAGIASAAFSVVAGPAVTVWFAGPDYEASGYLLPIVVGALGVFTLAQLQQFVPGAMTRDLSSSARAHGWAAVFNVVATILVVPRFGYWGAAWTTLVAYGLALLLVTQAVRRLLPEMVWPQSLWRMALLVVPSVGGALAVRPFAGGVIAALVLGLLMVLLVLALAALLGLLNRADVEPLRLSRWRKAPKP